MKYFDILAMFMAFGVLAFVMMMTKNITFKSECTQRTPIEMPVCK